MAWDGGHAAQRAWNVVAVQALERRRNGVALSPPNFNVARLDVSFHAHLANVNGRTHCKQSISYRVGTRRL
jgi:hypothetical protein